MPSQPSDRSPEPDVSAEVEKAQQSAEMVGEDLFETRRKKIGLWLGPLVFLLLYLLPTPGLNPAGHRLLAIVGLIITFWVTEALPLPVSALLGPALCILAGLGPPRNIFKSFGDPIIFLFIGSFLLAEAMFRHGLNRRIAFQILGAKSIAGNPIRVLTAFVAMTGFISMWISNTTATAMMYPIGLAMLGEMGGENSSKTRITAFGSALMLTAAFASSAGGFSTPVGAAPNLIGIGMIERTLNYKITFFEWAAFGFPLSLLLLGFLAFYFKRAAATGSNPAGRQWIEKQKKSMGPLSRGEKNVLVAFGITIFLWFLPGIFSLIGMENRVSGFFNQRLQEPVVALLGATLLFFLPAKSNTPTLTWQDAKQIDWGTILLFGGGLALGDLMFSTGLAEWLGAGLAGFLQLKSTFGLVVFFTVISVVVSELTSNTASASMVIPVAIAVSQAAGVSAFEPAIASCLASGMGSMLPVSTPPNAIVYGSGKVPLRLMMRHGLVFDLVGIVVIIILATWWVPLILGK